MRKKFYIFRLGRAVEGRVELRGATRPSARRARRSSRAPDISHIFSPLYKTSPVLQVLPRDVLDEFWLCLDADCSGEVSVAEFAAAMRVAGVDFVKVFFLEGSVWAVCVLCRTLI